MLYYVMLCYVMLCYDMLCYFISFHIDLYHIMTPYIENVILISKVDFIHILHSKKNEKTEEWKKKNLGTRKTVCLHKQE